MKLRTKSSGRQAPNHPEQVFRLDGRIALVTGATGHLGEPVTRALCAAGAHVIVNARNGGSASRLAQNLKSRGLQATALAFDVTDEKKVRLAIKKIETEFGCLDIVVNNAYSGRPGTIVGATTKDFADAYRICVEAAFSIVQMAHPLLKRGVSAKRGGASVVNIASMYGSVSPDPRIYGDSGANNPPFYGPAKAGLIQLTRYLACHLALDRIRVNAISPGGIYDKQAPSFVKRYCKEVPLGRMASPSDIVGGVIYLASEASSYVTGQNLMIDGGWSTW